MKNILLRNVPDEVHRQTKMAAAAAGVSLQSFIIGLMQREVAKGKPRK